MKQFFTIALLLITMLANSAPATPSPAAVKSFEAKYGKQLTANWTCTPDGCQAEFEFKGQHITAFYSHSGKLRWYERHILSTQLPVALQMNLKKYMGKYWISDVKEQSGKGTLYTVAVENASVKMVLTNVGNGWQVAAKKMKA